MSHNEDANYQQGYFYAHPDCFRLFKSTLGVADPSKKAANVTIPTSFPSQIRIGVFLLHRTG